MPRSSFSLSLPVLLALHLLAVGCGSDAAGSASEDSRETRHKLSPKVAQKGKPTGVVKNDGLFFRQPKKARESRYSLDDVSAEKLARLGYLTGYRESREVSGVVLNDGDRTFSGYNLYTSGHAPVATLTDMDGKVIHSWEYDLNKEFKHRMRKRVDVKMGLKFFRRAYLFPNGELIAMADHVGVLKLDRGSRKIWFNSSDVHHDFDVTRSGTVYALGEKLIRNKLVGWKGKVRDNPILKIDRNGKTVARTSLLRCFVRTYGKEELVKLLKVKGTPDIFHGNSIDVIEGDFTSLHPALKRGRVLVSLRTPSIIAVVDLAAQKVNLVLKGQKNETWYHQHEAKLTEKGNIIFFDNTGRPKNSRVLELAPPDWEPVWTYEGDPPESFFSLFHGTQQRLPNGNTLITESDWGRAFEVTREKEIVWEFASPHRSQDDPSLVAVLCDVTRLDKKFSLGWLPR